MTLTFLPSLTMAGETAVIVVATAVAVGVGVGVELVVGVGVGEGTPWQPGVVPQALAVWVAFAGIVGRAVATRAG